MALLRRQNRDAASFSEQSARNEFENIFDQYVASDNILDTEHHLFEADFVDAEWPALRGKRMSGTAAGPRAVNTAKRVEAQEPWHMAWHQVAALPASSQGGNSTFYKEASGRAVVSDGDLFSLEGRIPQIHPLIPSSSRLTPSSPHSAPSSIKWTPEDYPAPSADVCRRDPTTVPRRQHRRKNYRESSTMNHMSTYHQQDPAPHWRQQINPSSSTSSNLQVPPRTLLCTPPPSTGGRGYRGGLTPKGETINGSFDYNGHHRVSPQERQFSVQSSPAVVIQHTQRPGMPQRSISSNYPLGTAYSSTVSSYHSSAPDVFPASPGFEASQPQPWGYPARTVSVSQPSQPAYQISHVDPQHQKSLMQYPSRDYDSQMLDSTAPIASAGLMIDNANPPSPEDQLMTGMADDNPSIYYSASDEQMAILTTDMSQGHSFDGSPTKQSQLSASPNSPPSRSSSRSPGPQGHCRRPSKTIPGSSRVRKPSGGGGYSGGQQPRTPTSEQFPSSSRRKQSSGSGFSSGQQPHSPSNEIVFQNLTANDSQAILAGVAPSGSSKTKERREREAREKRRRVGELAYEAVREAGGDPEVLVRMGLLPK
ncbi:hypothetical protein GP486_001555 [Trichoglossum hirsutum]|uniref:Developmental regulatory protein wetA n=1 Tax=Trichoglossum hirsutum TaxID=265104 RepID=A0A9P8LGM4_9PEZI|nr:hypothetical protein GP486_001555 [Trichoglossum hirsutum]